MTPIKPSNDNTLVVLGFGVAIALALVVGVVNVAWPLEDGEYVPLESIQPVQGPNIKPLECGIERVVPPESFMATYQTENGLEIHLFDTSGDGKRDVEIAIPQGDENRYPLFYAFDRAPFDPKGPPDIIYQDTLRDGTCDGINVYWTPRFDPKQQA